MPPSKPQLPGVIKGLGVTLKEAFKTMFPDGPFAAPSPSKGAQTVLYPREKEIPANRSRGVISLNEENCTSCMLCARECPDWCIYIESHKEEVPATEPGGRARQKNMLDRFAIDFSLCMYCGICIEVCPSDALFLSPEFEYAEFDIRDLTHESDRLGGWMGSVPPPPLNDPRAAEAKEVTVARAAADKVIAEHERTRDQ